MQINLHWTFIFYKLSAARKAVYHNVTSNKNVVTESALQLSTAFWITLWTVSVRLIEQYNLKHYFFDGNNTILQIVCWTLHCYIRIFSGLKDKNTLHYLSFVTYFAKDFQLFVRKFQSMKPFMHILCGETETNQMKAPKQRKNGVKHALLLTKVLAKPKW